MCVCVCMHMDEHVYSYLPLQSPSVLTVLLALLPVFMSQKQRSNLTLHKINHLSAERVNFFIITQ